MEEIREREGNLREWNVDPVPILRKFDRMMRKAGSEYKKTGRLPYSSELCLADMLHELVARQKGVSVLSIRSLFCEWAVREAWAAWDKLNAIEVSA